MTPTEMWLSSLASAWSYVAVRVALACCVAPAAALLMLSLAMAATRWWPESGKR